MNSARAGHRPTAADRTGLEANDRRLGAAGHRPARTGGWRTARVAQASTTAVQIVLDLLAADAPAPDVAAAIAHATSTARRLVGWPSFEAVTRLLSAAGHCTCRGTDSHAPACDLDDARRTLQEALRFDGFLPSLTHPGSTGLDLAGGSEVLQEGRA